MTLEAFNTTMTPATISAPPKRNLCGQFEKSPSSSPGRARLSKSFRMMPPRTGIGLSPKKMARTPARIRMTPIAVSTYVPPVTLIRSSHPLACHDPLPSFATGSFEEAKIANFHEKLPLLIRIIDLLAALKVLDNRRLISGTHKFDARRHLGAEIRPSYWRVPGVLGARSARRPKYQKNHPCSTSHDT